MTNDLPRPTFQNLNSMFAYVSFLLLKLPLLILILLLGLLERNSINIALSQFTMCKSFTYQESSHLGCVASVERSGKEWNKKRMRFGEKRNSIVLPFCKEEMDWV